MFAALLTFFLCSPPPGGSSQQPATRINVGLILPDGLLQQSAANGTNPARLLDDINEKLLREGALTNYQLMWEITFLEDPSTYTCT